MSNRDPKSSKSVPYAWRDLRFDVPAGFADDSVLSFSKDGAVSVTVSRDVVVSSVDAYAREQEAAVKAARAKAGNYAATGPAPLAGVAGAFVVDRSFADPGGAIEQRQAFISGGKGVVVVVTGTTRAGSGDLAKKAVVDVVQTIKVGAT